MEELAMVTAAAPWRDGRFCLAHRKGKERDFKDEGPVVLGKRNAVIAKY